MAVSAVCRPVRLFESEPSVLDRIFSASPREACACAPEACALPETIVGETPALHLRMSKTNLPLVLHLKYIFQ